MKQSTDRELWDAIRKDDESSFAQLYERYWQKMYAASYHWLHDRETASEIVHDIFLHLWQKRRSLEIKTFPAYLTAATRYQVYKRLRSKNSLRIVYPGVMEDETGIVSQNEGEQHLYSGDLQQQVDTHLDDLPDRCREIYNLSRKEQLNNTEIAERLQISKRTVENQITRALQHLRSSLGDLSFFLIVLLNIV